MNLLDVQDKIKAGEYRSDRHPAVPFVTFVDVLRQSGVNAVAGVDTFIGQMRAQPYPLCGASLSMGSDRTYFCALRMGHAANGSEHDWAAFVFKGFR